MLDPARYSLPIDPSVRITTDIGFSVRGATYRGGMETFFALAVLGLAVYLLMKLLMWVLKVFGAILSLPSAPNSSSRGFPANYDELDGMNEGDDHNGPHGYVAGSGYLEARDEQRGDD